MGLASGALASLKINSTQGTVCRATNSDVGGTSLYGEISCSGSIYLAAGNTVSAQVYQHSSGAVNVNGRFSGVLLTGGTGGGGTDTLAGLSCSTNEIPKWNGSAWACAADEEGGGSVADGDKGDIVVSNSGADWTIDTASIVGSKIANGAIGASHIANGSISGSKIANGAIGASHIEIGAIDASRIADAAISGSKIANNAVTTAKIANSNVTNAKLANMAANTLKGNNTGGAAAPIDLTVAQLRTMLGSGTQNNTTYLRGDGTWAAPGFATAAGSNGQIQFKSGPNLAADAALQWDNTNKLLGIGTTPSSKLEVANSDGNRHGIAIVNSGSGIGDAAWLSNATPGGRVLALHKTGGTGDIMQAYYNGGSGNSIRLTLGNTGAMWIAGTLTQNSDMTLKKDIADIPDALERISRLRGVSYRWKDPQRGAEQQLGLLAQEVEKIFPEVVSTQADGTKGVAYTSLIGPLIESIKELKADNDNLRAELKAANDNYQDLRREIDALKVAR
mgnify:CR=1 FL=1